MIEVTGHKSCHTGSRKWRRSHRSQRSGRRVNAVAGNRVGHLVRDAWHAPTLGQKLVVLFGRPGETYTFKPKAEPDDLAGIEPGLVAAE